MEGREFASGADLAKSLHTITVNVPQPHVHLDIDERLHDVGSAHVIVRCVQEIVTNAARHSGAENLWIVVKLEQLVSAIRALAAGQTLFQPAITDRLLRARGKSTPPPLERLTDRELEVIRLIARLKKSG